jgi:hypothetical protein
MGTTASILGVGLLCTYAGKSLLANYMMRARVAAQATTIAVVAGTLYRWEKHKQEHYEQWQKAQEEKKQQLQQELPQEQNQQ